MGAYLQNQGKQNVYLMAPNYQAGKDVLAGFKRFFKGKLPVKSILSSHSLISRPSLRSYELLIRRLSSHSTLECWRPIRAAVCTGWPQG